MELGGLAYNVIEADFRYKKRSRKDPRDFYSLWKDLQMKGLLNQAFSGPNYPAISKSVF